jgi:hypothetical protein
VSRTRHGLGGLTACALTYLAAMGACRSKRPEPARAPHAVPSAGASAAPVRGAAGDEDLRVMLTQLVSANACERLRGHFQALPATGRPGVMSGALWIRGCRVSNTGTTTKLRLEGNGWQWVDEQQKKAGGTFTVRQYVRFGVVATIVGTLDVGYDPASHVASIWFSLRGEPEVRFTPLGKLDVDAEGAWSSVLGAVASVLAKSPSTSAKQEAAKQGLSAFKEQLAAGLSVTVDLCTGLTRSGVGHTPRGTMVAPGVGETKNVSVELHSGGLMVFGPHAAGDGMTVNAEVAGGKARLQLVCDEHVGELAQAFLDGRAPPRGPVLTSRDVGGKATLRAKAARCPVSLVATLPAGGPDTVTLSWRRPATETARSTGGPLIHCPE